MNTANKLTMLRILMIPVFMVFLYLGLPYYFALSVFLLASATDFADGYIARRYNQITDFGKFMDPLADKLLVMAAMAWFVQVGAMPAWAFLIVIGREFAVTALRLIAVDKGRVIAADFSGKLKTVVTMVALSVMMCPISDLINLVCWVAILVVTTYSGMDYFIKNRDIF